MLKTIVMNLEIMESMLYFWESVKDKEKVGESFINSITSKEEMQNIYNEDFTAESVRLVLSAVSNRELLNSQNKKELKLWNNNMWMLEDMDNMKTMLLPLKTLNLQDIQQELPSNISDALTEIIEIVFYPGTTETWSQKGNGIYINFFKIFVPFDASIGQIESMEIKQFIKSCIEQMTY